MSVTYPADPAKPYGDRLEAQQIGGAQDEPFVPVYARRGKARGGQGKIRTWMILTPVAVLTLGGIGAMLILSGDEQGSAPLAEPAATAPVLSGLPAPTETAVASLASASAPEPIIAETPVVRESVPQRRIAPAPTARSRTPDPAPEVTPRVEAPVTPTGPQPYTTAPATAPTTTLNTAPAAPVAPAPQPPIVIEPVG